MTLLSNKAPRDYSVLARKWLGGGGGGGAPGGEEVVGMLGYRSVESWQAVTSEKSAFVKSSPKVIGNLNLCPYIPTCYAIALLCWC